MMNKTSYIHYIRRLAVFVFWGLIAYVTRLLLMEHIGTLPGFPHLDKIIHFCLFTMLTLVGYIAYANYKKRLCISLAIYGAVTEIMQEIFTETRFASVYDWLADVIGILFAVIVIKIIINNFKSKSSYAN